MGSIAYYDEIMHAYGRNEFFHKPDPEVRPPPSGRRPAAARAPRGPPSGRRRRPD